MKIATITKAAILLGNKGYVTLSFEQGANHCHTSLYLFLDFNEKQGVEIAEKLLAFLRDRGIPINFCRGQGYKNGSNMSGKHKGAQKVILKENPLALYSPCACHSLNLCGVHAAECCPDAITFFGNIQKLFNFFSSSPPRWEILKKCIGGSLHSSSQTRWSAKIAAVQPVCQK